MNITKITIHINVLSNLDNINSIDSINDMLNIIMYNRYSECEFVGLAPRSLAKVWVVATTD